MIVFGEEEDELTDCRVVNETYYRHRIYRIACDQNAYPIYTKSDISDNISMKYYPDEMCPIYPISNIFV